MIQLKGKTRYILLILGGLFLIFLIWYFSAIVTYIIISVVLSFLGRPLVRWISLVRVKNYRIDNILFQPLIYSSSVKAHPLEIFLVILAAGNMAGIVGMFLAIPTYTIIRVVAKEFFENMKLVRKLTENLEQ